MYTAVLATMLAAGSATPAWHNRPSCSCSCYAGYSYGCYSSCYSGCHGYPGYRLFPIFHRHHCHAYYCSSCSSCTSYVYSSCSTCSVCSHPVYVYSAPGCCTAPVAVSTPRVIAVPPAGNPEVEALRREVERLRKALQEKSEKVPPPKKDTEEVVSVAPVVSRVTVTLPSDARLWIENVECPLTSSVRSFNTPPLNAHQQYFYNIRVEVVRDGRPTSQTQRVIINPGQEVRVDFNGSAVGTAAR